MPTEICPLCGEKALIQKHGDFLFEPPSNIPGGAVVVVEATWRECQACGEGLLPDELDQAIENECQRRVNALTSASVAH